MRLYLRMSIPESKEAAIEAAPTAQSEVAVFSDGTGHDGQIGAAEVIYRGGIEKRAMRKYMDGEECHTVFESGLLGISLAAEMIIAERHI